MTESSTVAKHALAAVLSAALIVAPLAAPSPAGAADVLRPLRTLIYDVAVAVGRPRRTQQPAAMPLQVGTRRRSTARAISATGVDDDRTPSVVAQGAIEADVVAATGDGGLIVDLIETASGRDHTKVRFAVGADGSVGYDPKLASSVSGEELALVRWLARGFYTEHPTEPGAAWTVDQSGNGISGIERYHVTANAAHRVTLDYAMEEKIAGADAYGETREGSLVYDTALIVPVRASYSGETRRQSFGANDATFVSVTLTLRTDSFEKSP